MQLSTTTATGTLAVNSLSMKSSTKNQDESDASMRQRLLTSLSQSFPGSALSKALHCMTSDSEDEDMKSDPLSSSCFAELRLEKEEIEEDDDLTSLAWLQDRDLLKNMNAGEDDNGRSEQKENDDLSRGGPYTAHPTNVPYNPHKHVNSKPPYSFSCLIFMAIEDSPMKKLPVKDIYSWILTHFPYFQHAPTGWKNSVRHNLSLNKCFKKVEKERGQCIGKGSLWCIDPDYRPNLLQALRKTPYHPYHQLQMLATPTSSHQYYLQAGSLKPMPLSTRIGPNSVSPHLFPFLSKRLSQSTYDFDDNDIKDVAQTLVSLKGLSGNSSRLSNNTCSSADYTRMKLKRKYGSAFYPLYRRHAPVDMVCTSNPSEDHTYSATTIEDFPPSPSSSIDEEYDFGSEEAESDLESFHSDDWVSECDEVDGGEQLVPVSKMSKLSREDEAEEQKKIVEGADALLNLAGFMRSPAVFNPSPQSTSNVDIDLNIVKEEETQDSDHTSSRITDKS